MRHPALIGLVSLLAMTPSAQASFPGGDGELLRADLFTDRQGAHTTYLRTLPLPGGAPSEWLPCAQGMGFLCGGMTTPDVTSVRYSADGQRLAAVLSASAPSAPQGIVGLATMASTSTTYFAVDARFVAIEGLAAVAWAPDGSELVAERSGSLVRLSLDGGELGTIARRGRAPDWSSRGEVAFERSRCADCASYVWVLKPGRPARRLTRGESPSWSPDGRHVAFERDGHVYTIRRDGGKLRRLIRRGATRPVWSPSGRRVALSSSLDLYVVRRDGGRLRRLVDYVRPDRVAGYGVRVGPIDWRPVPD